MAEATGRLAGIGQLKFNIVKAALLYYKIGRLVICYAGFHRHANRLSLKPKSSSCLLATLASLGITFLRAEESFLPVVGKNFRIQFLQTPV